MSETREIRRSVLNTGVKTLHSLLSFQLETRRAAEPNAVLYRRRSKDHLFAQLKILNYKREKKEHNNNLKILIHLSIPISN